MIPNGFKRLLKTLLTISICMHNTINMRYSCYHVFKAGGCSHTFFAFVKHNDNMIFSPNLRTSSIRSIFICKYFIQTSNSKYFICFSIVILKRLNASKLLNFYLECEKQNITLFFASYYLNQWVMTLTNVV